MAPKSESFAKTYGDSKNYGLMTNLQLQAIIDKTAWDRKYRPVTVYGRKYLLYFRVSYWSLEDCEDPVNYGFHESTSLCPKELRSWVRELAISRCKSIMDT